MAAMRCSRRGGRSRQWSRGRRRPWPPILSGTRSSGTDVGLPPGQMGNSEVGHLNIGAGRVVMQELQRINDVMADGRIKSAPARAAIEKVSARLGNEPT